MIGKGKAISHTKASIEYGWDLNKDADIVFKQNLAGETPKEVTEEFKIIQSMNEKCKRNTFSFVLSPTIEDGKKLNNNGLNIITKEFIKELKLENHQAIAFVHNDKNHKHIHLYINRINFKGKAYNDSFIGKRSQKTAERVAEKLQLKTVKQIQQEKLNGLKIIRSEIHKHHLNCLKMYKPRSFQNYIDLMIKYKIKVNPVINKQNKLQGFRYHFKGTNLKGSEVHRSMSINKLAPQINLRKEYVKNNGIQLTNKIVQLPTNLVISIMKSLVKNSVK
ncbi:relaxase/mobilization nuclease-like protein [Lutibacter sp. Hel_I_33_5]|uniref:relaxase/mobilization nuclease domain-containing protein n=1 Tax=Lutibacter sp. Hel_I_33_5 TaxID=1566289 RepID=UPI0011AAE0F9|nr:relaxase/mobilization nuclease domain-containing protein [Lutibacter sp. Hel_I_33_5]TVZ56935.1 relaxase/mobilization nuclease-like protein [Lutibacter sp. Hel_I_33_5]